MRAWAAVLLLGFLVGTASAQDRIYAEEQDRASQQRIEAKSKRLIPGETQTLRPGGEYLLVVKCEERLPAHYRVEIGLKRGEESLVTSRVLLARDRPFEFSTPEKIWRLWVN